MTSATDRKLKVALFGLGRLGAIRANILVNLQPDIELVAASDPKPGAEQWAAQNLPPTVQFFADPVECLEKGGAEAVLISTATATHAPLVLKALDLGLHVMCEKPIAVDVETTKKVVEKAKSRPELKFLVPFCRRYDDSYRSLKKLVEAGELGEIHAVDSTCLDQQDPTGFFVTFSAQSGGIFVDMGVHDIDIARYYLDVTKGLSNPKKQVNKVFALGQTAVYTDLNKYGDADNGFALVEFANGKLLTFHLGRTLTNGFEGATRVFGTKGSAVVNGNSFVNRVEVRDQHGVRTATTPDAFVLYEKSFVNDLKEFATSILHDKPLTLTPDDALEAAKIATALQYSFRKGVPVYFDEEGDPIME
ncbi:hypothetical protein I302_103116 [Kwoniella bestiolae CBS 10118]|uniref:NAD-binding Rossmann fold oxidoreductase n=1 Tax=Kwoniella bestiolae CBS 10118 TaxID=1296100 RepID=A0A1B9GH53_9TREE|nr:NAD-binding Rossmann fold oxidoreductase [Kwoniella bestiolae CBS 10118]OCF30297.1 NAD-binding Rossmann fold oxidoreductase [Kwoniella bestiolae CBS 10118]